MAEVIGEYGQQIKPVIDIDAYINEPNIDCIIKELNQIFPNKKVKYAKRDVGDTKKGKKYSYRFYIQGVRMLSKNIKQILIDNGLDKDNKYDLSIYDKNKILFLPLTTRKVNENVPPLIPIDCNIFDCCASYIEEDYEDYDIKYQKVEEIHNPTNIIVDEDISDEDDIEDTNKYLKLQKLINMMSDRRASDFDTWIRVIWAIMNISNRENISEKKVERLIHQFSAKSKSNYDEDKVDEWIIGNRDKLKEKGYGWKYIYETCIQEDAPDYFNRLTKSYSNFKKEFEKTHLKILHPPMIVCNENNKLILQPINLCEKSYGHEKVHIKTTNNKGETIFKEVKFITKWLDDPQIRKYKSYSFIPPPLLVNSNEYNTWTDFDILRTPYVKNDNLIDRFLEYARNLFNNEEIVNYLIAFFSNRIQKPAHRNNVCIILYGEEGDGKNRFLDIFKNIVGERYFIELESGKQLFSSHSTIEKEKLFVCVNEAKGKDNYENSEILKARITTNKILLNPKGIQEFEIENYCDYIMTTNNYNAVNIQDKSRRYLFVETTSHYSRNSEFFNHFSNEIVENKCALRCIYEYLMNFDVKSIIPSGNFQNHIPITEIQQQIIKDNRDKIEIFLRDLTDKPEYVNDIDEGKNLRILIYLING